MAALAVSFVPAKNLHVTPLPGYFSKQAEHHHVHFSYRNWLLSYAIHRKVKPTTCKGPLVIRAGYSGERGTASSTSIFIGGFILGGLIVGTLGCVFAPQISKALAGADRKDLMRRLPKFIYDEEKALEKTRRILTEKIAQLNSAIDDVSSQLRAEHDGSGAAVASDEVEAPM